MLQVDDHSHHLHQRLAGGAVLILPGHVGHQHSTAVHPDHRRRDGPAQPPQQPAFVSEQPRDHLQPGRRRSGYARCWTDCRSGPAPASRRRQPLPVQHRLRPGQTGSLTVSVDRGKLASTPQLGWLIATLDDPNGAAQADEIPIGPPGP